jgi:hypothetical protein
MLLKLWATMMVAALLLAAVATPPPRRPYTAWALDFLVRWGLAGLFIWFLFTGLWAVRELMNMRLILPFTPLEAALEYYTYWSAALTGMATFLFLGSALLLNAIFTKPAAVEAVREVEAEARARN